MEAAWDRSSVVFRVYLCPEGQTRIILLITGNNTTELSGKVICVITCASSRTNRLFIYRNNSHVVIYVLFMLCGLRFVKLFYLFVSSLTLPLLFTYCTT